MEEYEEFEEGNNLLIVNPPDDDKKVVYLSNINSCSLPITPKDVNNDNPNQNYHENTKKVFEYKIFDSLKKSHSDKGSPKEKSRENTSELKEIKIEEEEKRGMSSERPRENFEDDYKLRMIIGSEKLVREFK